MNTIYHLFPAHTTHLTPSIISSIIRFSHFNHFFFIYLNDEDTKETYECFFKKLNYNNYLFIGEPFSKKSLFYYSIYECLYPCNHVKYSKKEKNLYGKLLSDKVENLIIHGEIKMYGSGLYKTISISRTPTIWVCWGGIPSEIYKSIYYRFTINYYKNKFFKNLIKICTLTNSDKNKLNQRFGIEQIDYCPYIIGRQYKQYSKNNTYKKVLVGNSGHYVHSYLEVIEWLKDIDNLDITFMVPYGLDNDYKKETFLTLKQKAQLYFGDRAHFWDKVLSFDEYEEEMSKYSAYICNVSRQTGLGAATHALYYGMKVYLKDTNYNHYKNKGFIVHHVDELKSIKTVDSLFEVSKFEVDTNKQKYLESYELKGLRINKWEEIYKDLLHHK